MADSMLVHYDVDRAIATITLDSPANRNALSAGSSASSTEHLAYGGRRRRACAPSCSPTPARTFCAGADLKQATDGDPAAGRAHLVRSCARSSSCPSR